MRQHGGKVFRTEVGDRFVMDALVQQQLNLGGEQSGHMIFRDFTTTGDGLIAALQIIAIMLRTGKPLSELRRVLNKFPQVLRNVTVREKIPFEQFDRLTERLREAESRLNGKGRVMLRYSGTEPKARLLLEGPDADELQTAGRSDRRGIGKEPRRVNYLVTGTDTGVGKTFVTSGLIRFSRSKGIDSVGMKPICTGDNNDVHQLLEACGSCEPEHLHQPGLVPDTGRAVYRVDHRGSSDRSRARFDEAFEHLASRHSQRPGRRRWWHCGPDSGSLRLSRSRARAAPAGDHRRRQPPWRPESHAADRRSRSGGRSEMLFDRLEFGARESDISQSTNLSVLESLVDVADSRRRTQPA